MNSSKRNGFLDSKLSQGWEQFPPSHPSIANKNGTERDVLKRNFHNIVDDDLKLYTIYKIRKWF